MPQETNLNINPYFDDFDRNKNYYRVLFKPGYPIQARELTTLQSVLQNQIEQFGSHFFKEGAKVIPGQLTYISNFYAVELDSEYSGIPVSLYLNNLIGLKIYGRTSGVRAKVVKVLTTEESERGNITLYVDYIESSTNDLSQREFSNNEVLVAESPIQFGNTFIPIGEGFANTISTNSTSIGSAFALSNGVYFLRGTFVEVFDQILILDQYSNKPSYRVGLNVDEQIITSDDDETLTDNSQGYNNYSAPGADRLKISASLAKKDLNDFDNSRFVQLATVQNGVLREINNNTEYNILGDELAKRTFDESGHYYVKSFTTLCKESLNDGIGNGGIFNEGELTYGGTVPSKDLAVYKVSPGKAYVKGYPVEFESPTFLDAPKPRTTKTVENQAVNFNFTPTLVVDNVTGSPLIGFNTTTTISLRSDRVGSNPYTASGEEIGIARIYDFVLEQGGYDVSNLDTNRWDLSLFDIQTYSKATLNEPVTLTVPTFIQGESTGATGYLKEAVSGVSTITIYQISGQFSEKENIIFNNSNQDQNSRFITNIQNYGISDVKSVYSTVGVGKTFTADTVQSNLSVIGNATITAASPAGISTITVTGSNISGIVTTGNLIKYTQPGISTISYAKIGTVSYTLNQFQISSVESVSGVVNGSLPTSQINVNDLTVLGTKLQSSGNSGNVSGNNSLYSVLPKQNVSSVDLTNSQLTIRKQFITNISSNSTSPIDAEENEVFLPFDEERYTLIRSDGSLETLTQDRFDFQNGSTRLVINNLGSNDTGSILIATLRKTNIKSKSKKKKIVDNIIVNKSSNSFSGIGQSTTNDGLTYGNYPYGTRVQDKEICLNYPDVGILYGIFESNDTSDPQSPFATIGSMDGLTSTTNDLIIGESIIGKTSGAKALYTERKSDTSVGFVYINDIRFINGEVISFEQSSVNGVISSINSGSKNVTENYNLITGQTPTFYDYSKIVRNSNSVEPQRKLKIIFSRGYYESSDLGDITTVNSYNSFDYGTEISKISGYRLSDIIDFRPRVSDYVVSAGSRSPFEFSGRTFNNSNHSSREVISSDESLTLSYSYYLPRIDRIYLTKDKTFALKYGNPSDNPSLPEEVSGAMNIANIYLPAYLYSTSDAKIEFIEHKRYQMKDIFNLENRIKNLEYYTSLSLLETATQNLFVDDGNGLNRFKSGFFVDNFSSLLTQDLSNGVKNSIDPSKGELRPSHYTSNIKLEVANNTITGIGSTTQANDDKRYSGIAGNNVRRTGDVITLDYTDVSWLRQPFATRTENVTPFFVKLWEGSIQLYPTADVWIDTNRLEINRVEMEGSFLGVAEALRTEISTTEDGQRLGVSPVIWNSWETTGIDVNRTVESNTSSSSNLITSNSTGLRRGDAQEFERFTGQSSRNGVPSTFLVGTQTTNVDRITTTSTTTNSFLNTRVDQQRSGVQYVVNEQIDTESLGDRVVRRDVITFMRSRNIEFTSRRMKPYTQVYSFFDGVNVSEHCFSKLVEIQMISGSFQVGETVVGQYIATGGSDRTVVQFRVAQSNHKYGPYNNPTDTFDRNPYNRDITIPESYSSTSTILNIDTYSLAEEANATFFGLIKSGMLLRGLTSGAEASVTNIRLVTDRIGTLIGSFRVPNGLFGDPQFETGRSRFRLTSSSINSQIPGVVTTVSEETFYSQGEVDTLQETTLSLRNARVEVDNSFRQSRSLSDTALIDSNTSTSTTTTRVSTNTRLTGEYRDPLAQSFIVDDVTGIYLTKLDLFFSTKDETLPVTVQIREVELGTPSQKILPFSEVELTPDKINISDDASVPTTFEFESPVYLEGQREYAIIVISNSNEYNVWISRLGESDVATLGSERNQVLVTTQRLLGSLFKSQNASTWTPSQYEDLTFELYRANFATTGFTQFFNSDLPDNLKIMTKDPLTIQSNKVRVSLSSTISNPNLTLGNTIIQESVGVSTATGNLVGYAGSAFGNLKVISAGIGYTGSGITYTGIALTSITGSGLNATANITISNGGVVASGATIVNGGFGYVVGDILEPISIGSQNLGSGMRLSVSQISGNNELIVDNIQGEFGVGSTVRFVNNSGIKTDFTNNGTQLTISNINIISSGDHIKVFHRNHGMHSSNNIVTLSNIRSDVETVLLTNQYPSASGIENELFISDTTNFTQFENVTVSPSNPGYIRILDEILSYTGTTSNSLTGVSRQIDSTKGFNYRTSTIVEKYELGGVSLRRINKDHNLSDVDQVIQDPITADEYYIKIDMSSNGVDRSINTGSGKLKFNRSIKIGGSEGKATYNIPYEMIIPNIRQTSPTGTSIKSTIQTVSGTSLGGNEVSFVDKGLQDITNNMMNYFDSPRIIASKINENTYLSDLPANKSLNLNLNLSTSDSRVSPTVDLSNNSLVLISNKVNNPITNYSEDFRVNTIDEDPNLFTYISNQIILQNPASSIKLIFDAYVHNDSDIRALYSTGENNNVFVLFPGYSNINPTTQTTIDAVNNDGTPDIKMVKQDRFISNTSPSDFKEYTFTANLPTSFRQFRIKLIGTSQNQAYVPIIRNLRAIALA